MCLFPKKAYIVRNEIEHKYSISFRPSLLSWVCGVIDLPCGKCVECLQAYASTWALRCMLESTLHKDNCFITLTYASAPPSVDKRELQCFFKLLRKEIDCKIKYYSCGEYGSKGGRPHYHACIFGWQPDDLEYFYTTKEGNKVYKSAFVEDIWSRTNCPTTYDHNGDLIYRNLSHGFISVMELDFKAAKYCAKYMQKLNDYPDDVQPPFTMQSQSLGWNALDIPVVLKTGQIYYQGKAYPLPKAFIEKFEREGVIMTDITAFREYQS